MFLTNKQSLALSGIVMLAFFLAGVFDLLDNFMVILILVVGFLAVVVNIILVFKNKKNPD